MTLPSRLEIVQESARPVTGAPPNPNPVGQAVTEAVIRQRHMWDREPP
jgi:hypothetical protein